MYSVPSAWCVHDDHWFLSQSLRSFESAGPLTVFLSRTAWDGTDGCWERCEEVARTTGAEVVLGDWQSEAEHRRAALAEMKARGHSHVLIPDSDEIVEPQLLTHLLRIAEGDLAGAVRVHMKTYWKSARYQIQPPETLAPILMVDARVAEHERIREYHSDRLLVLEPEYGVLHHLSYAGPDERILRKISTWGHKSEVVQDWYRRVWLGWDRDHSMRDLHPTHAFCYGCAERVEVPEILKGAWDERPVAPCPARPKNWPKVSVVIPLHGGPEDIEHCLESLTASSDLLHEVVVVDDASPDSACDAARKSGFASAQRARKGKAGSPEFVLLQNEKNLGFAATCNKGFAASSGDVVLFLNSDTRLPRAGLIRLIESLMSSGAVGAAGPYTNNAGYHQGMRPTYSDISRMDLFAQDFASRSSEDLDVEMLVGFCLAVRRSVIEEMGEAPFDERFERALYEDTDLCYRILRAGYKLRLSARAYVHHEGSKSLARMEVHPHVYLKANQERYRAKWRQDLESGFASHLSGDSPEPIVFRENLRPERRRARLAELAQQANISLCMIVKNEERVLGECLASVQGVFSQVVVVDTGSTDSTKAIAEAHGAEVHEFPWTNSFSEARNQSLKHASGSWVFWMDADDTLPIETAEAIVGAVLNAPAEVSAYVVPVQFVEEGPGAGTRVDHVKLFRNLPGIEFKFRIHEQILPSFRALGGEIARIEQPVLHSGYDTSEMGQINKRKRDWPLLYKDREENEDHPFVFFNLGMTAYYTMNFADGSKYLRHCIKLSTNGESHVRKAYALLGMCEVAKKNLKSGLHVFKEGLAAVGDDPELRFQAAKALDELGRLDEAKEMYLSVKPLTGGEFSSFDISILGYKRSFNLGSVCLRMGDYAGGKEWLLRALDEAPHCAGAALLLFEGAMNAADLGECVKCADVVLQRLGPNEDWTSLKVRLGQRIGDDSLDILKRLHLANRNQLGPALLLARELLAGGDELSAEQILTGLAHHGCAEASFHLGVMEIRRGNFALAYRFTLHAHQLAPDHEQTKIQLAKLEELLAQGAAA